MIKRFYRKMPTAYLTISFYFTQYLCKNHVKKYILTYD